MPVLVEAFSVITRKDRVEQCYPGGMEGFLQDCPNRTVCFDDHLVRVGFMDPDSVRKFVANLEDHGLVHRDERGHAQGSVVVNQGHGLTTPCDWAEVFAVNLAGATVDICRLAATDSRRLACPGWWRPERATQQSLVHMSPDEMKSRMEFLREENGVTACRDRVTGKIMYSAGLKTAQPALCQGVPDSPDCERPRSVWGGVSVTFPQVLNQSVAAAQNVRMQGNPFELRRFHPKYETPAGWRRQSPVCKQ